MTLTENVAQNVSVLAQAADANGNPNGATLSNLNYTSSDSTIFTVAADPNTPGGVLITGVAAGKATLTATGVASDNGAGASVSGSLDVVISPAAVGATTQIVFKVGTPA